MTSTPRRLALSLLSAAFVVLAACGGTDESEETAPAPTSSTVDPTSGVVDVASVVEQLAVALARETNAMGVFSDDGQVTAAHLEQAVRDYEATEPDNIDLPRPGEAAASGCATLSYRTATGSVYWHVEVRDGVAVTAAGTCMF